jgi:hypothetical protein
MKKLIALAALLLVACSGETTSTTEKPQGAAKLWLQAALDRDDARLNALTLPEFQDRAPGLANVIREKYQPGDPFQWGGSGLEGQDYAWTATGAGGVIFFKVRKTGDSDHKVSHVEVSW